MFANTYLVPTTKIDSQKPIEIQIVEQIGAIHSYILSFLFYIEKCRWMGFIFLLKGWLAIQNCRILTNISKKEEIFWTTMKWNELKGLFLTWTHELKFRLDCIMTGKWKKSFSFETFFFKIISVAFQILNNRSFISNLEMVELSKIYLSLWIDLNSIYIFIEVYLIC